MNKEYITWELYNDEVRDLAEQIEESEFKPDVVVGIMRGGTIPAIMISHHFDVPCVAVPLSYRDHVVDQVGVVDEICHQYAGRNILFVEDIVDSGKTMMELQNYIMDFCRLYWPPRKSFPIIRYAAVWFNRGQEIGVNYFSQSFDRSDNKDWFVFPYEKQ